MKSKKSGLEEHLRNLHNMERKKLPSKTLILVHNSTKMAQKKEEKKEREREREEEEEERNHMYQIIRQTIYKKVK